MSENLNQLNEASEPGRVAVYSRVSAANQAPVRAVAYLRVSADESQRARQLVAQQEGVNRFAGDAGYEMVRWYADTGAAGSHQPAMTRLIGDANSTERDFDLVIVWSFSRVSRNPREFAQLRRTLAEAGVRIISATESASGPELEDLFRDLGHGSGDFHVA